MAQPHHSPINESYYIVILLLIAYVMSSAPRYVREFREQQEKTWPVPSAPAIEWKETLKAYTIQPYVNAWHRLRPGTELAAILR